MNKVVRIAVLSSALLINSTFAFAEEIATQEATTVEATDTVSSTTTTETTTSTGTIATSATVTPTPKDAEFASQLSKTYSINVTAQEVANNRNTGLGYGEIGNLYGLATLSGKPVSEITTMRQTLGWGEIAQSLGVKVSDIKDVNKDNVKNEGTVKENSVAKNETAKSNSDSTKGTSSKSSSSKGGSSGGNSGGGKGGSGGKGGGGGGHR